MTAIEQREAIEDRICEIMVKHGPDGHVDGYENLTDYALELIAAERERCANIAGQWAASVWNIYEKTPSGVAEAIAEDIRKGELD